jgi:hypothetical protein
MDGDNNNINETVANAVCTDAALPDAAEQGAAEQGVVRSGETQESDELLKELENLRAENKILRDSLVEDMDEEPDGGEKNIEKILHGLGEMLSTTASKAKENLNPGAEKLTETLRHHIEENPVPVLLSVFGAGYLIGRRLDRGNRK